MILDGNFNLAGIRALLNSNCVKCNIYEKEGMNKKCPECPFTYTSASTKGEPSRFGLSAEYFKPLGLVPDYASGNYREGKSNLFMYLYYDRLNWNPPPIVGTKDRFGNDLTADSLFLIHHIDGNHYNDSKDNLMWCLKSEHNQIGKYEKDVKEMEKKSLESLCNNIKVEYICFKPLWERIVKIFGPPKKRTKKNKKVF